MKRSTLVLTARNGRNNVRSAAARAAAHALHAQRDSRELTLAARRAFETRWEALVDPQQLLEPAERARRAAHAKRSYYGRLGVLSGKARRNAA